MWLGCVWVVLWAEKLVFSMVAETDARKVVKLGSVLVSKTVD